MRIALLIDSLDCGGAEGVVQRLAVGLARRGHAAFVYCLTYVGVEDPALRAAGVAVRQARSVGRDLLLGARLYRWLRGDRIQIVHAHSSTSLTHVFLPARLLGLPVIHVRHGRLLAPASAAQRLAERLDVFVDRLVVVSESERRRLPRRAACRAVCIPNGRDLPPPDACAARQLLQTVCGQGIDGPVVLSVGTLCPEKDTLGLLEAFALLRRRIPRAALVCVGAARDSGYWQRVLSRVDQLGLRSAVHFPGRVPEAWRLMAAADVFCLASRTEAMPNVIVEAMSQQVPIVATTVGDVGRVLRDGQTALLVPSGRPQELADALWHCLCDKNAAQQRASRAAEEYRRLYTGELMLSRYEKLYRDCLGRQAERRAGAERPLRVLMVGPGPDQIGGMASVISALCESPLRHSVRLYRFCTRGASASGRGGLVRGGWHHLRMLARLAQKLWQTRVDIVHVHTCSFFSFYRSLMDALVAKLLGGKVVLHVHGGQFARFCAARGRIARGLIRLAAELADAVVVLSHRWQHRLRPYLGCARLAVIPNAVGQFDGRSTGPRRQSDGLCRFIYLGALSPAKGLAELVEAAWRLRAAGVGFELTLAGPAPPDGVEPELEARLRAAEAAGLVKILGPVTGRARNELFSSADCLVLPSHCEALPMVLLEAGAAGLAVIATAVGDIPELLAPEGPEAEQMLCGLLIRPGDPAALAEAMQRVASDVSLRRELAQRLHQRVRNSYSLSHAAVRCAVLYRQVRSGTRRRPDEWLCRRVIFPAHERLRGRATLAELRDLIRLAALPPEQVREIGAGRLRALLRFASEHLPYYSEQFARCGIRVESGDPFEELSRLPVLHKEQVRANAERMVWREVPGGLIPCVSGGTSGDTLHFFIDRVRAAQSMAARLFMQMQFGILPGDRRCWLWGSPIELKRSRLRAWRDRLINEIVLDAFDMSPPTAQRYLQQIIATQPRVLIGYTSAVARLAQQALQSTRPADFRSLALVVVTGDEVHPEHREVITQAFGCPVASEYGSREVGLIAHECPHGRMHIISPHVLVETLLDGQRVTGRAGHIVCTNLNTRAQPLIRYALGDVGKLVSGACECGLPFPLMEITAGRITGFVALPGGILRHGHLLPYVIRQDPAIRDFRVYQRALDHFEVLLAPNGRLTSQSIERVRAGLRNYLGSEVRIDCRVVESVPADPSGKLRHLVSDVAGAYLDFELEPLPAEAHSPKTFSPPCCLAH